MAYRDLNGRITIDEAAANADIRRMQTAINILEGSKKALSVVIAEAESMKGETTKAVESKAREMNEEIQSLINGLKETQGYISKVVKKYKALDAKYAAILAQKKGG